MNKKPKDLTVSNRKYLDKLAKSDKQIEDGKVAKVVFSDEDVRGDIAN